MLRRNIRIVKETAGSCRCIWSLCPFPDGRNMHIIHLSLMRAAFMIIVTDWLIRLTGTTAARGAVILAFACLSLLLAGCAGVPVPASLEDRAGIQRVTVVPDTVPPETHFETYAVGAGAGMGKGAAEASVKALASGGGGSVGVLLAIALLPLIAAGGAAYGASIAVPADRAAAIETLPKQLLATTAIERRLAQLVAEAGRDSGYVLALAPENADRSPSGAPVGADSDALLETDVTDFYFKGDGDDPDIAMYVRAKARLVRMPAHKTLGESTFVLQSESRKLNQWLDDGGKPLHAAFDTLLRNLARDIVDRRLLHYPYGLLHYPSGQLNPYGSLNDIELELRGPSAISPGSSFLWPPTVDTLQPTLAWNAFTIPDKASDTAGGMTRAATLGYEVCIWREYEPGQWSARGCIYRHRGGPETSHTIETPLPPGTRYRWSVRMRFKVDSDEYLTGWNRRPLEFYTPATASDRKP